MCERGAGIPFELLSAWVMAMDQQLKDWKLAVERLFAADAPDWHEVFGLVTSISGASENPTLRLAAMQSMPSLRNATSRWADGEARLVARRRLAIVLEVLNTLTTPQFGRRGIATTLTPDERHRQLLGLPLGRMLAATEIHRAFKRAAKTAHPDGGGSESAFLELAAARDALMKAH
jgi:hypothetical protein